MMKLPNLLLTCALGAGSLLGVAAPASAARNAVVIARPPATGRLVPGYRYGNPYRYGYGYRYTNPYRYGYGVGYPYGYGVGIGVGYGGAYVGGGYGYAPYPAVYAPPAYVVRRPYWRPYRRAYWGPRFVH